MEQLGHVSRPWLSVPGLNAEEVESADTHNFGFYLSELVLSSGENIPINRTGVTAIVGGNNVGKSTLLREINGDIHGHTVPKLVLDTFSVEWEGNAADMLDWIANSYPYASGSSSNAAGFTAQSQGGGTFTISPTDLVIYRNQKVGRPLGPLAPFITHFATAMERFLHVQPVQKRSDFNDAPTHPIHYMEQNNDLFQQFLAAAKSIFDIDLTLDPLSGQLFFRVGKPSAPAPPIDNIASGEEYLEQLRAIPALHRQGDGMQSALALLMPVITASFPLILVDEPEAFLHPPQARKLGATLATLAHSRRIQLIVATHDRHFLTGLLDAEEVDVSVVRLSREAGTRATHLGADTLRSAWRTASLRHSNLLDGLFHRLVIIAENERDCRFYAAALEAMDEDMELPIRPHDALFVSSAGKGNIASLSEVLLKSGVPVVASPDLDIVNDEQSIEKLYELFGGNWNDLQATYRAATAEFRTPRALRKNRDVLRLIKTVLSQDPSGNYTSQTKVDVTDILRAENDWKRIKEYGVAGFKQERAKADELLRKLAEQQIVPVLVGELEGFAPQLNVRKGDAWLDAALETGAHRNQPVRAHMTSILKAAGFDIREPLLPLG